MRQARPECRGGPPLSCARRLAATGRDVPAASDGGQKPRGPAVTDHPSLLESLHGPSDLKRLSAEDLPRLAAEIRDFLVDKVTTTGGHLGPNLGVVELTIAVHRVFDSPTDAVVWDVGHQAYVHKVLTGRQDEFD